MMASALRTSPWFAAVRLGPSPRMIRTFERWFGRSCFPLGVGRVLQQLNDEPAVILTTELPLGVRKRGKLANLLGRGEPSTVEHLLAQQVPLFSRVVIGL
jgi:hypothetical protein